MGEQESKKRPPRRPLSSGRLEWILLVTDPCTVSPWLAKAMHVVQGLQIKRCDGSWYLVLKPALALLDCKRIGRIMRDGILTTARGVGLEPRHAPKRQALNANRTPTVHNIHVP